MFVFKSFRILILLFTSSFFLYSLCLRTKHSLSIGSEIIHVYFFGDISCEVRLSTCLPYVDLVLGVTL